MIKIGLYCTSCGKLISSGELNSRSGSNVTDAKDLLNQLSEGVLSVVLGETRYDVCKECYHKIGDTVLGSLWAIKDHKDIGEEIKITKKRGKTDD